MLGLAVVLMARARLGLDKGQQRGFECTRTLVLTVQIHPPVKRGAFEIRVNPFHRLKRGAFEIRVGPVTACEPSIRGVAILLVLGTR